MAYTIRYGPPGSIHTLRYVKPTDVMAAYDRLVASGEKDVTISTIHGEKLDPEAVRKQLGKISRADA